eukprot:13531134-Ditylum_brightwellii.AAC.1
MLEILDFGIFNSKVTHNQAKDITLLNNIVARSRSVVGVCTSTRCLYSRARPVSSSITALANNSFAAM